MTIICFDYGHGGRDPGAVYRGRKEKDDNLQLGSLVAKELRRFGLVVDEVRKTDKNLSLKERSDFEKKKKYDAFVSFHRNAFKPEKARGAETYTFLKQTKRAKDLAENIQAALKGVGFADRGIKKSNFHVLRETRSPAVLIEIGFIDNSLDNELFDKKNEKIVKAIAKAILESFNIAYEEEKQDEETYYRVVCGYFKSQLNAKKKVKMLKEAGFDSVIISFKK